MSRSKKLKRSKKKKLISLLIILSILFLLITCLIFGFYYGLKGLRNNVSKLPSNEKDKISEDLNTNEANTITLTAVGDIMVHMPQLTAQYDSSTNSYCFDNNFQHIKNYVKNSDFSIANLETTLAGSSIGYSSYPVFNSPDSLSTALNNCGFNILSTINNHSLDKGDLGLKRTLKILKQDGFDVVGTKNSSYEKNFIIKKKHGISLGITSFSYAEIKNSIKYVNGLPASSDTSDKINVFDVHNIDNAFNSISKTLSEMNNTDIKIVILHWGNEYQRVPSSFQTSLAQKLCDVGVDIIIGSHPHVVQPVDIITSSDNKKETLVIYSLGNFLSNQRRELMGTSYTEDGLLVNINITKKSKYGTARISKVECIPTWLNKYYTDSKSVYEIIPISNKEELSNIKNLPYDKLKKSFKNTTSLIKNSDLISYPKNLF